MSNDSREFEKEYAIKEDHFDYEQPQEDWYISMCREYGKGAVDASLASGSSAWV